MAILTYNNFDLLLHQSLEGYGARELASPVGETSTEFRPPLGEQGREAALWQLGGTRTLGVAQEEARCP